VTDRRVRKPGPDAVIHRVHRRKVGPGIPVEIALQGPQFKAGARFGQQLADSKAVRP
jgi:hypothetical protein